MRRWRFHLCGLHGLGEELSRAGDGVRVKGLRTRPLASGPQSPRAEGTGVGGQRELAQSLTLGVPGPRAERQGTETMTRQPQTRRVCCGCVGAGLGAFTGV